MKRVIIKKEVDDTIDINEVPLSVPIFIKDNGKLIGMVVEEYEGWRLEA